MIASHHLLLLLLYPQSCIYIIFNLTKHYTFPTKHETITITNWKNHIILWNEIWYLHSPFHSHFTIHVTPTFRFGMKIIKKNSFSFPIPYCIVLALRLLAHSTRTHFTSFSHTKNVYQPWEPICKMAAGGNFPSKILLQKNRLIRSILW